MNPGFVSELAISLDYFGADDDRPHHFGDGLAT
jgi:hypothetical protein